MKTVICKVVAQTEAVYVPSKKADNGQLAKSMIRLRELGGDYEDEYICAMFGHLALCKFAVGAVVRGGRLASSCCGRELGGAFGVA